MATYKDLKEIHGEEFAKKLAEAFNINTDEQATEEHDHSEDESDDSYVSDDSYESDDNSEEHYEYVPLTFRQKAVIGLSRFLSSRYVWYVAGIIDAAIVYGLYRLFV